MECIICLNDIVNSHQLECKHQFCINCIIEHIKTKNLLKILPQCPLCRTTIQMNNELKLQYDRNIMLSSISHISSNIESYRQGQNNSFNNNSLETSNFCVIILEYFIEVINIRFNNFDKILSTDLLKPIHSYINIYIDNITDTQKIIDFDQILLIIKNNIKLFIIEDYTENIFCKIVSYVEQIINVDNSEKISLYYHILNHIDDYMKKDLIFNQNIIRNYIISNNINMITVIILIVLLTFIWLSHR
jgi:hypothetical protein